MTEKRKTEQTERGESYMIQQTQSREAYMIQMEHVYFSYTGEPFIRNIDFSVKKGEIFGFLGPSGAGKSTLQKLLTGLLTAYTGSARVMGVECSRHDGSFYEKIGVDFEFPSVYDKLTARENLSYFSSLYSGSKRDMEELLSRVGLKHDGDKKLSEYSKGMKSRLNFIKALMHDPDILFLDEPTSGLDPNNARIMKDMIRREKEAGKTIILTTHNMLDATELCDRVAFIVNGEIKALDTPHNLIMSQGAKRVSYTFLDEQGKEQVRQSSLLQVSEDGLLFEKLADNAITSIHSSEPTLDDIFRKITGYQLC